MKNSSLFVFRVGFLLVYLSSLVFPLETVSAATVPATGNMLSATAVGKLTPASTPSDAGSTPLASAAPGPDPAPGGYTIASQADFAARDNVVVSGPITIGQNAPVNSDPLIGQFSPALNAPSSSHSSFASGLVITPITAYNVIVDSNVLSPSSYGPNSATLGAKYCNTSGSAMTDVWAYIGNRTANTPGVYPVITPAQAAINTGNAALGSANTTDYGGTIFSLKHAGGSLGISDASRYLGTLQPGECRTEYWLITYPRIACTNGQPCNTSNPTKMDVTGGVKPDDDLWLQYDFWGKTGATTEYYTRYLTMRNEISAMANKIWPNGDNKVPPEYIAAIQQVTGWSTWTPSGSNVAYPGQVATSQGIWYDFGNIGAGFDNNYDFTPDRNAWVQPIGDASSYDPGCFRLIKTYGLVIVKLNDGTELLIPFVDQMYFENIPSNNTGAVGLVYYQYVALDGACSAGLTPYQEVASGYDNEKFNADFGAGLPPLQSQQTNLGYVKSGLDPATGNPITSVAAGGTIKYSMTFTLPESGSPTMFISVGSPSVGMPLVYEDSIPLGMSFSSVSSTVTMTNYSSPTLTANMLYSLDGGTTWSTTAPTAGAVSGPAANQQIKIQWWLPEAIDQKTQGNGAVTGTVSFQATTPGTNPPPLVTNTSCLKMGNGPGFKCASTTTLITGSFSLSGTVFCDDGTQTSSSGPCSTGTAASTLGNGTLDAGGGEPGMPNISVNLYYDSNGNGSWDATDLVVDAAKITDASGNYSFTNLSAGTYFTKVIIADPDIQSTYGISTPDTRKATITNANITGLNFGFAPPLTVNKAVHSFGTLYVGDTINYNITLTNNLPGGTGTGNSCTYTIWSSTVVPDGSSTPPGGGSTNAQWLSPASAGGRPDGSFAYTDLSNNLNQIGLKGFNTDPSLLPGNITGVKYLVEFNVRSPLAADATFTIVTYYNNLASTFSAPVYNGSAFPGGLGTAYSTTYDIFSLKTWTAADFANNSTGLQIQARKGTGSSSGNMNLDAAAFLVTTDQPCPNSSATTLNPAPLTDTFDNTKFTFVSADPPISSSSTVGNITTLTWNNVGPISAGSYKTVDVSLQAIASGTNISDTVASTNPKFANGLPANDASASALTTVTAATANGLISGRIFDDNSAPVNGWVFNAACTPGSATGPNCTLEAADTALQNVRVNLLACVNVATGVLVTTAGTNKTCADQSGSWVVWASTFTNATGDYTFSGLRQGFYREQVDTTTLPGAVQTADPNVTAGTCGANCDNQSYGDLRLDSITFGNITGSNSIYNVNFGYNFSNNTYSVGDEVYFDWNGNGIRDAGDELIPGATLRLLDVTGNQLSTTTTPSPATTYTFAGLRNGIYTIQVSSLPNIPLSQTGDPEQPGVTCTSCDNLTTFTINGANDTVRDFGYQPSGTAVIGDTVWKDMNGDGVQSGTQETGIANITVNLLTDFDNNGTWVTAKTTTTDSTGKYQFTNLPNGTYRVQVDTADTDMPKDAFGSNYVATNGSLYTSITVVGGVVTSMTNATSGVTSTTANGFGDAVENDPLNLDADFGFAPLASIGDTIYWDSNANGTQDTGEPGINGVTVRLYTFTDLPDGKYTSGETFTDTNGNGRWDSGETFTDSLGNGRYDPGETLSGSPVATATTATSNGQAGKYLFTGLDTDKNGVNYVVVVDPTSAPIAASVLNADPSADGVPSNCVAINLSAANCDARDGMKLFPGSNYMGADFGFLPLGSFGDTLWIDTNNNGILDAGEHGIPNITVTAVATTNVTVNGTNFPAGTTLTTSTDANGNYFFQNIIPIGANATWTVTVNTADPDFPASLTQTYDPDGTLSNSTTVIVSTTGVVTTVGGCTTTPNGCDGETDALNMDADFGYDYSGAGALSGTICLDSGYTTAAANTAGDNVGNCGVDRNDTSGIGAGEAAYDNVTVYLYRWIDGNSNSNIDAGETTQIAVTNTDVNGDFSFTNIPDSGGVYYIVAIGAPQSGMELTTQVNDSPTVGNDAKETVVESNPTVAGVDYADVSAYEVVLVPAGDTVTNVDFAFAPAGSYDYGDLPDTYSTTLQGNPDGPRHLVSATPTLYLGTAANNTQALLVDANGQPTADATGDGTDEDGVTFTYDAADTNWSDGVNVTVNVTAYVAAPTSGSNNDAYLVAWMDFNHDGDFADSGEMITSRGVENGLNTFTVAVPAGTFPSTSGTINSRFRLFSNSETPPIPSLAYSGVATNGEVEDYQQSWNLTIDKDTSTPNVTPNGTVVYTVALVNTGNQALTNIQASDTLPDFNGATAGKGYTVSNVTATGGLTVNFPGFNGDTVTTLLNGTGSLAAGATSTITITLTLSSASIATYDNTALASSTQTGTIDDDGLTAQDSNTPTGSDPETDEDVNITRVVTLSKSWVNAIVNDAVTISVIRGGLTIGTLASTANTATEIDTASSAIAVTPGDVLTFSEAFNTGLSANYNQVLSCTGAADTNLADGLTVNAADSSIVCTYTNTRKSASLTLRKTWVNATNGDAVNIPATTGFANNTTLLSSTSTGNNTTTGTPVTVYAGETGTLGTESFTTGLAANYTSTLTCSGATDTNLADGLTVNGADTAIICTYSNTLNTADLSILKDDGVTTYSAGGSVTYTVTVSNLSGLTVNNALVSDTKPANILNWAWACTSQNVGATGCDAAASGTSNFSDTVNLPVGGSIVYTVTANIVAAPTGNLVNTATVAVPAGFTDTNLTNNSSTDTDTLAAVYSISGQVRYDIDNDASFADPDSGLASAQVSLYTDPNGDGDPADGVQVGATVTTTATGNYTFNNLSAGNYVVVEVNPTGYTSTADTAAPNNDRIPVVITNANSTGNNFLDTLLLSISGQVRNDVDSDGNFADPDSGLASAQVSLYTDPNGDGDPADGAQVGATVTTTATGNYSFASLIPGNYVVVEVNPTGYASTADTAAPNNDRIPVVLTTTNSTGNDFLDTVVYSVSGQVRYDIDNDANFADPDSGLASAQVALYTDPNGDGDPADGVQVGTTITTTGTGNYTFNNVIPGNYVVVEVNPTGYTSTADTAAPNNDRIPVVITNANSTGNNFLDTLLLNVSGQVRNDVDSDGNFADPDSGLASAQVSLYTDPNGDGDPADGTQVGATVTTTATGNYSFTGLIPGNYVVVEVNPTGYASTADTAAPNNDRIPVVLTTTNSTGNDFLDTAVYSVSGQVRYDIDNDANFADPDSGLASAQVALYTDPNGDGDPADGVQVGTTITTTGTGNYTFNNVIPGNYVVVEVNPTGYTSTADTAAPNNDRIPVVISNANSTGNNFLDTLLLNISGQVRNDVDSDGNFADPDSGLASAQVSLYTDPNGDGDPADGAQVGATVTTTATGNYSFTGLIPGNYVVVEVNPTGYASTADTAAPNNDRIPAVLTTANSTGNDFLDTAVYSVSGQVRYDIDNDANFADPDSGLASAQVSLFTDPNGDGDPADGVQVGATVTTTGTGNFTFSNVLPGNYVVVEVNPTGYTSTADTTAPNNDRIPVVITNANSTGNNFLDTLLLSISGQVRNDVDSDGNFADPDSGLASAQVSLYTDPNGDGDPADGAQVGATVTTTATGNYSFTSLIPGNYVVVEVNPTGYASTADTAAPNNDRIPVVLTTTNSTGNDFLDTAVYSVSGQVRYDIDNDANFADPDSGLASAQVALYTDPNGDGDPADGVQVGATVTTTGTGNYTFNNVIPGNYVVVEVNPTGYTSTADTAAPNNDRIPVVITNANSTGNNFLDTLLLSISGQVRNDVDSDGNFADPDSGLASAQVSLYTDPNGDGDPADGAQVGATVTTTATGNYSFTSLIPGNYVVVEVNPTGYASTADTAAPNNDRVPVVLTTTNSTGNDFLDTAVYSVSGQVRYDIDNDANFADPDSGLASAQVSLYTDPNGDGDPADGVQVGATVTTTGTGNYTFNNVIPGNYVVVEVNPTGYTSTADTVGANNDRVPVVITNANSTGNNFLDTLLLSISGQVRNDVDSDGNFADPDSGLASAQVSLYTDPNGDGNPADGTQVGVTVTTTATGNYSFTGLIPGNYVVVEVNPTGYASTADTAAPNNDRVPVILTNTNSTGNDFLDTAVYSVSGQVRYDIDNDGNFADADSGLASAQVSLYTDPNGDGDPADGVQIGATVTTTGTGNYTFNNVIPGNYVVVEVNPTGYTSTADTAAPNNDRIPVVITNANSTGNNFLDTLLLSISGQVRNDVDSDGNFADPDSGLTSAQVSLYTDPNGDGDPADGTQVGATVTTTATGNYSFTSLIPGNYVVVEVNPTGYASTADTAAPNNDRIPVVLTTTNSTGNDFLDTVVYSVSGQVRYDIDNDANFADPDSGLASAQVALYTDPNGDGDPADGVQVGTTITTTGTGNYTFNNVIPGNYVVVEVNPTGYTSTADTAGANNDRIPVVITNANSTGNNFLDTLLLSISGQVRNDIDSDGNFADPDSGLASAQVSLYTDPNGDGDPADGVQVGTTVTTTATGNYSFTGLIPRNYVVVEVNPTGYTSTADTAAPNNDRIPVVLTTTNSTGNDFLDTAAYSITGQVRYDTDNDGSFADPDSGLASAQVSLYTDPNGDGDPADGVQVGATVTTTGTGNYTFSNVLPGNYVVVEVNPAGYTSTADTAGANNDRVPVVITNANSTGNNFLDTLVYSVSGQVRYDVDNDASFADPDSGLASAQVSLYTDPNGDGDPADGTQVGATVTTTGTGNYTFNNVVPGNYVVVEVNPTGYTSTADITAPNNDRIPVVVTNANRTGNDFLDTLLLSISGQVRNDVDNDGNLADPDSGLASAQVSLYTDPNGDGDPADGVKVGATVTTTGTGNYSFTGLLPGNYVVVEVNPAGYNSTADSAGPNNDRIPVVLTNANSTGNVFLDWINAQIQIVKTPSATVISSGGSVTYSYVVTNPGAVSLTSVSVSDDKCSPVTYVSGDTNTNSTLETNETWNYTCTTTLTVNTTNTATVTGKDPLNNTIQDIDTATVTVVSSGISKTIVSGGTSETFTTGNNVAIGEIVTYEISIDLPAGLAFNNVVVTDKMDKGLAFVDCLLVDVAGTNVTGTVCNPPATPVVSSITDPGDSAANPANPGRQVQFNIGNIGAPAVASKLTIRYRVIVLDVIENQENVNLNNNVTWAWTGGSLSTSAPNVTIVEPDLFVDKSANPTTAAAGTAITFTLFVYHTPQSQTDAFDVVVSDVIPSGLTYVPCTLSYSGLAPDVTKRPADPCNLGTTTLTLGWDTFPLGQTSTITFQATMNGTQTSVTNTASVAWSSLPIDPGAGGAPVQLSAYNGKSTERVYDPGDPVNIYRVSDSVTITTPTSCPTCVTDSASLSKVKSLPSTGFAPNVVTDIPGQPATMAYAASDVWLEVPSLKLKMPIVGVPMVNDQWDVTWLTKQAGWLNGTSFPTWVGNSVLTSHVYLANGKPGPFVNLGTLKYGDKIIVHAYGNAYTYEVRENKVIAPNDTSVLGHKDTAWVTLITCKTYNESANTYENRIAVQAELVSVKEDTTTLPSNRGR
jgi:LPXTG-site transpeptidase (sortase) family protein